MRFGGGYSQRDNRSRLRSIPLQLATAYDQYAAKRQLARHQHPPKGLAKHHGQLYGKGWVDPPSVAKSKNAEARLYIDRDCVARKAVELRLHLVAGTEVYYTARTKAAKQFVEMFDELTWLSSGFSNARLHLARSVIEGVTALYMGSPSHDSRFMLAGESEARAWWYPAKFERKLTSDHLRLEYTDGYTPTTIDGEIVPEPRSYYWTYQEAATRRQFVLDMDPQRPEWLLQSYEDGADSFGYGNGLLDPLYYYLDIKAKLLEALIAGLDRNGWPWLIAKLRGGADSGGGLGENTMGEGFQSNQTRAQNMVNALARSRGQYKVLGIDAEEEVTAITADGNAVQHHLSAIEYCDKCMVELVLASSMPTGGGEQGSFARAAVEAGSTSSLIKFDRMLLEETLRPMTQALWLYNRRRGNWGEAGAMFGNLCPLRLSIGREERDDPQAALDMADTMVNSLGMPVRRAEVYKRVGWEQPDDDDDVVQPPGAGGMVPGMGGMATSPLDGMPTQGVPTGTPGDGVVMSEQGNGDALAAAGELGEMQHGLAALKSGTYGDAALSYIHKHRAEMERLNRSLRRIGRAS